MENGDIYLCGGGIHRRIMQTFDIQCQNLPNFQPLKRKPQRKQGIENIISSFGIIKNLKNLPWNFTMNGFFHLITS